MPKLSIITPTARKGGIDVWYEGLKNQTFTDFEAILTDQLGDWRKEAVADFIKDERVKHIQSPQKREGMFWNLDGAVNDALRRATGDLVLVLQDYILLPPKALETLVATYERLGQFNEKLILTGVGHKYRAPNLRVKDLGAKISVYDKNFTDGEELEVFEKDPRIQGRGLHVCNPIEWEANYGLFPMQAALDVGGFDEDFDAGWGYDNVNFAERCERAGYLNWLDETNEVYSISHENLFKEIDFKAEAPNNEELWARKYQETKKGNFKCSYLDGVAK